MLDLIAALACLVLAALLVVAFWLTTREPKRPAEAKEVEPQRKPVRSGWYDSDRMAADPFAPRYWCLHCDTTAPSSARAIAHAGATGHCMTQRRPRTRAQQARRALRPVTITDGEVEEIGGGAR
ncbi:MAG TPA: hypothetical protein VFT57_15820 [Gemmatimonadaceae bacterium]|nr:hypothetical protein [Gemmatimonadaceae bacterium]